MIFFPMQIQYLPRQRVSVVEMTFRNYSKIMTFSMRTVVWEVLGGGGVGTGSREGK